MVSQKAQYIKQRLSLREPLQESLDILAEVASLISLQKVPGQSTEEKDKYLQECLAVIKSLYPKCSNFERDFPSICFSIATGVGKTRLMGACISWLYLEKGIRNFFVLAPNLTIYDKLIQDFGNPAYPKYVFNGIAEFVHNRPLIITGDNYNQQGNLFKDNEIRINIFNIAKFNSDSKGTKKGGIAQPPRIKRLSEFLGQSYWSYLSGLSDLVILMDEAHRYHADASKAAINELQPVLGIELTATPLDEKGNAFKNVVYEYSLAKALEDGKYVKNPAIAKRKNFDAKGLTEKDIETIKLEDAISIHEDTKTHLELYAATNNLPKVKPFILVVCKDINHAKAVFDDINSDSFYLGAYRNKALQIDSSTRSEDEVERQFLSLEQPDNQIEIVIHVNMLKEGWDVTNLYTIVPLRAANASVLIEQTIGRGLRLPYKGERTGVDKVDKLTVVAHENFDKVIAEAQNPNSVLNKMSFVEIDPVQLAEKTQVITSVSTVSAELVQEQNKVETIADPVQKQKAQTSLDAKKAIIQALPSMGANSIVRNKADLTKPEVQKAVMEKISETLNQGQLNLLTDTILAEAATIYQSVVTSWQKNTIEIPRMDLVQDEVKVWFEDFDLDTTNGFDQRILEEEIIVRDLKGHKTDSIGVLHGVRNQSPANLIILELTNYPEVDYRSNPALFQKLTLQALSKLESTLSDPTRLPILVRQSKAILASRIYEQLKKHFRMGEPQYSEPKVLPFVAIEEPKLIEIINLPKRDYRDSIRPLSDVPKYVFLGFEKACHLEYKFDSNTEKDFAFILENDKEVINWLRPASRQFRIYWDNNSKLYEPDFIVETADTIYMVETKKEKDIDSKEVESKAVAALKYCNYATAYTTKNGGKPWKYLLVPHTEVSTTNSFGWYVGRHLK